MAQLLIVTGLLAAVAPVVGIPTGRPAAGTDHTDTRRILRRADVPAKYTKPTQPPILWNYTVEAIWEEAYRYTNETKAVTDKIVASVTPANATFDNVLLPLELFNNRVSTWINGGFLAYVSADPALREAAADTDDYFSAFFAAHNARNDVFALVKAVWEKQGPNATIPNDLPKLDKEAAKILELTYKGSVGAGLGIPAGPARDDYLATRTRISELQNRFAERLRNIQGGVWFDPSELDGVPQSAKDRFAKGEPGTPNEGKLFMSFTDQDVSSVTNYAFNPQTRRKAYVAYENRAADNSPILKETVVLRDKAARALGYPSHAAYRQEERMAKNPANVNKFLSGLREHLADRAAQQLQHLLDVKKADMASRNVSSQFDGSFYLWDWAYHNRLVVENEYNINRFEVSQYFSALPTIATMLDIFSDLMGFVFVELTEADLAALSPTGKAKDVRWHEDVIAFSVWEDEAGGSGFVGYLLLDLYPRPGKRGGGATFTLSPAFLANEDVPANAATAALVMNLNPPSAPGEPGLLLFGDVVTMFHELGHGMHVLSMRSRFASLSSFGGIAWDFVEAPSQIFENWLYEPVVLKQIGRHYKTGAPMPDELINRIIAAKNVNGAAYVGRQLHYAVWDMAIHEFKSHEEAQAVDPTALYNNIRLDITKLKGEEAFGGNSTWGHADGTFQHVMGNYDAGYYGYLWSEVYSIDMYHTAFKANPLNGTVGRLYRKTVLQPGGVEDPNILLERFLGRPANSEAFYKELDS